MLDLMRFTLTVRKNYRNVPYHNWVHAFSVAHSMYTVIKTCRHQLTHLEVGTVEMSHLEVGTVSVTPRGRHCTSHLEVGTVSITPRGRHCTSHLEVGTVSITPRGRHCTSHLEVGTYLSHLEVDTVRHI